jgi:outer membrane protein TolC
MKKYLFILFLAAVSTAHSERLLIDLPTALRLADEKNTDLAIQVEKVARAELDKSAAWYQWVPTLRIGASYGWQNGALQETDGSIIDVERNSRYAGMGAGAYGAGMPARPGLSAGIDLSEAIYAPLAARRHFQAAKLGEESTRLRVMLDVAAAYYELVRSSREVEIAKLSADNAGKLAKQTADFAASGEGLQADAERAEVESLIQQQKVELARERKETSVIKLVQVLRLDDSIQLAAADSMITPLALMDPGAVLEDLVFHALEVRPEIGQNRATLAAEDARLQQEKYGIFLPKVEVGYSYGSFGGGAGTGNSYDDSRNDLYGMIYWQFESLGLRNRNNIKKQRTMMNETKAHQEQAMVDIVAEVRMAHTEFTGAQRQLDLSKRAVDSARKSYELNSERIFENQGLPLEALQAIKALAEAESLYLAVATKYNMAQLRLVSATGTGLEIPIP